MSKIEKLVAFQAAIELLKENGKEHIIHETYQTIMELKKAGNISARNVVQDIYAPFTEDEISAKIGKMLKPKNFEIPVEIVYQPLANLVKAIPNHIGDWYFSGNYPTPGGTRVSNQSFLNFYDKNGDRPY